MATLAHPRPSVTAGGDASAPPTVPTPSVSTAEVAEQASAVLADAAAVATHERVRVYGWAQRLWHWVMTLNLLVLGVTGYLIGSPPATRAGEASASFQFGWIRLIHFAAAWILIVGFLARLYLAVVGSRHEREILYLPVWRKDFWRGVWDELKWYAFLSRRPHKHVGHNPLARASMFGLFFLGSLFMIFTGLALYGEGLGTGSWEYRWFAWVFTLFGGSFRVHAWHHLGMWVLAVFALVHVYAVIREEIMGRQTTLSTMISGWRYFKDKEP